MDDREVIGPYRIVRILGRGGMGMVLEGIHQAIGRRVAIKVLHAELASNAEHAQRFLNEACAANSINHPSIVDVYDMGTLPDGTTYLVMEFIEGETLSRRRESRGGTLPIAEAAWIGREIALAMAAAHNEGIVHRDLKPDNVMLAMHADSARGERVKLLDFGIAKVRPGLGHAKAQTLIGTVMGTLWYMSPEQLKNTADVDWRADVYSLGALLYHLLTGQPPFRASSEAEQIALHLTQTPLPLRSQDPRIPQPLGDLVDGMLRKDPASRPTMTEVANQLAHVASETEPAYSIVSTMNRPAGETFVRSDVGASADRGLASSADEAVSASRTHITAPASASTLSGSAIELREEQPKQWQWLAIIGVAMLIPAIGLVLWATLKAPRPGRMVSAAARSTALVDASSPAKPLPNTATATSTSGATPPPATSPPVQTEAPDASERPPNVESGMVLKAPFPGNRGSEAMNRAGLQRSKPALPLIPVTERCIVASTPKLSPDQRKALAKAAGQLSLIPYQAIRFTQEAGVMVLKTRGAISDSSAKRFSDALSKLFARSHQLLPTDVTLKCSPRWAL